MKRTVIHVKTIAQSVLFIGFGVQILLGLLWMCSAFTGFQEFGDSYRYLEALEKFPLDEYTGVLYPLFLAIFGGTKGVVEYHLSMAIYLLQLAAAFAAGYHLFGNVKQIKMPVRIFGAAALATIPFLAQCHMAILPISFAVSALLFQLSVFAGGVLQRRFSFGRFCVILSLWLLQALLVPEYALFGACPVIAAGVLGFWFSESKKKTFFSELLLAAAFVGILVSIQSLTIQKGSHERTPRTLAFMLFSRTAGTGLEYLYGYFPEELKTYFSDEDLVEIGLYNENIDTVFGKTVTDIFGDKKASEIFRQLTGDACQVYRYDLKHYVATDLLAYTFAPVALQLQLQGKGGESYSGRNYEMMQMQNPILAKWYVNFGSKWFLMAGGLSVVILLCMLSNLLKKLWKYGLMILFPIAATAVMMIFWYTLQGYGRMDYKNTVFVTMMWMAGMIWCGLCGKKSGD